MSDTEQAQELEILAALIVDCLPRLTLAIIRRWLERTGTDKTAFEKLVIKPDEPGKKFIDKGD